MTERMASMDVRNAHRNYLSLRNQEIALKEAADASEKNYNTLTEEYSMSLVNNLQVIDSLRQYQDVQRRYNQAQYEARRNFWRLMVAIGETI
jgi:outer membrane protein TolC